MKTFLCYADEKYELKSEQDECSHEFVYEDPSNLKSNCVCQKCNKFVKGYNKRTKAQSER